MRFKEAWQNLDKGDLYLWPWPQDAASFKYQTALQVRTWLEDQMQRGLFADHREDYRELMEIASAYLGAQVMYSW